VAVTLAEADRAERSGRLAALRDRLWQGLEALGDVQRNGSALNTLPHNLNVSVGGVDGQRLHRILRQRLAVSSGSACSQGSPSHVLAALGRSRSQAAASIRFGLGRASDDACIDAALAAVTAAVTELRQTAAKAADPA
jgi:cysteine desulfurase